jgi:serine/threonine protein kinase
VVAELEIGDLIDGRYRLTGFLGSGGMGRVYRAEHVTIRRPVAIKLLHEHFAENESLGARFEREAFASGRLQHPNCVTVSDFGRLDDGTLYLVMELLDGRLLSDLLEEVGQLDMARALHITRHILAALSHAHAVSVIHRDVKPENVILVQEGDDPEFAKLLDFGIAKLVDARETPDGNAENLTSTGIAIGTPTYIAPEQALGGTVDARTDLYSVTVLLFELVTGRPPFKGADTAAVLRAHIAENPPRLVDVAPTLRPPASLEKMIKVGLAKQPDERYASADQYIAALDAVVADLQNQRREARVETASLGEERRWRRAVIPGGAVLLLLAAVVGGRAWSHSTAPTGPNPIAPPSPSADLPPSPLIMPVAPPVPTVANPVEPATQMLARGDVSGAIALLEHNRIAIVSDAHGMLVLGHAYCAADQRQQCISAYREAIRLDHSQADDRVLRANARAMADSTAAKSIPSLVLAWRFAALELSLDDVRKSLVTSASSARDKRIRSAARAVAQEGEMLDQVDLVLSYALDLQQLEPCEARHAVVAKLRQLGDPRAIAPLRKALYRRRGGLLGIGARDVNACLRQSALEAIAYLQKKSS